MAKRKPTKVEKDRKFAQKYADRLASPYTAAATATEADADRGMTDAEIAAKFSPAYDAAANAALGIGGAATNLYGNASSILSGLVGALPGSGSYDITSLLGGITADNAASGTLAGQFGVSLASDIRNNQAVNISGAEARRDERSDRLRAEARALQMQGDVASSDYLTPLNNILATRAARQNLAMLKLQMEAQRLANEKMGRGGSSGSGSTPTPDEETDAELQARLAKERSASMYAAASGNIAGLNSMISGGYQAADMGSSRPAPGRRY
jgi:hypothetical protein